MLNTDFEDDKIWKKYDEIREMINYVTVKKILVNLEDWFASKVSDCKISEDKIVGYYSKEKLY